MSIVIRTPETEREWIAYYDLRYRILRKPLNQALGSEKNDLDAIGIHFALYDNGALKAIARLDQPEIGTAQVRFVAVENGIQGKGYGKKIMTETEQVAKKRGDVQMILQARENAVNFYLGQGYQLIEKSHLLFGLVQHFLMKKVF